MKIKSDRRKPGWFIALCILTMIASASAQRTLVRGIVTDATGPIPGANIGIRGKLTIAISDTNGAYAIDASPSDTLVFSFLGFKAQSIAVNGRQTINVVLQQDELTLQEVVVNAGYYTVTDRERTGSIAKVTSKEIEKQPVANIIGTMQGRVAGVNIVQESGVAGGGFRINIRGTNSLREGANAPLYVIDGVPYSSDPISDLQTSTSIPGDGNPLSSINPSDIQSLEILKDADATAIYGSRGANGVVLITTKRGKAGKTTFSINTNHSFGKVTRMMEMMNTQQYIAMRQQAFANDGYTEYPFNAYDVNGMWDPNRYTDWQKKLIGGTAQISDFQASVSGGSHQTRFLLSGNYRTETSVFPGNSEYKRGGARLSLDHTSADQKFRFSFSGSYMAQDNDLPATDFVSLSRQLAPNAPSLYDAMGNLNWENSTWENPLANLESKSLSATTDLITNAVISYNITHNFQLKSSLGFTDLHNDDSRSLPSTMYNPAYNLGSQYSSIFINNYRRKSWIVEPQLNWNKHFGRSRLDLLMGATFQDQVGLKHTTLASGFPSNSLLYDLSSASSTAVLVNDETIYRYQAFFGRANYIFNGKYILNLTGRRDGSSRFGPGKQFASFGAVGAAWLFGEEAVVSRAIPFMSFGKLRASYGTTGNDQIGDYQYLDTYTTSGFQYGGVSGLQPARLFNGNFGWETNKKFEVAIETGFLKDRIFATAAWYKNRSSNQLVGLPLPGTTGFTSIQANLDATVENTGIEFTLRTINYKTANFEWISSFNITSSGNKLLSFPGLEQSGYRGQYVVGQPTTIVKLFHFTGVDPETGIYQFEDVNGDGVITYADDRETVKDFNPEFFGGLHNQFTYKGLQLDFLFQFVKQQNFNLAGTQRYAGLMINQPAEFVNSWQQPGDVAPYQMFTSGANQQALQAGEYFSASDGAVSDASFIRLKNISLSYAFPVKEVGCRFSLQAQNLLTITSYKGADPEFTMGGVLPPLRIISAGLQLTF